MRLFVIPFLTLALFSAGCSQGNPNKSANSSDEDTRLTITKPDGSKQIIVCPSSDERCSKITPKALEPISSDSICGQVYGGPEKARIVGKLNGKDIDVSFSRTDSCRIAQWERLDWLIGVGPTPNARDQLNSPGPNKPARPEERPDGPSQPR